MVISDCFEVSQLNLFQVIPNAGFVNPQYNFPPQSGKGVSGGFKVPPKMFDMPNKWKTGLLGGCCESPSLCLGVYCCPLCCLCKVRKIQTGFFFFFLYVSFNFPIFVSLIIFVFCFFHYSRSFLILVPFNFLKSQM